MPLLEQKICLSKDCEIGPNIDIQVPRARLTGITICVLCGESKSAPEIPHNPHLEPKPLMGQKVVTVRATGALQELQGEPAWPGMPKRELRQAVFI